MHRSMTDILCIAPGLDAWRLQLHCNLTLLMHALLAGT